MGERRSRPEHKARPIVRAQDDVLVDMMTEVGTGTDGGGFEVRKWEIEVLVRGEGVMSVGCAKRSFL
jgi:hypothetical protein